MTREEAINECLKIQAFGISENQISAMELAISALSVPEREKGEWIGKPSNEEQGERVFVWWKCSKCGQVIYSESEKDRKEFHAFCGRCGADMRGE